MCSQEPGTGPYPEQYEFSSHLHTLYLSLRYILILSSDLCLYLPNDFFLSGFLANISYEFSQFSHVCYMPCPLYPLIILLVLIEGVMDHCTQ